MRVGYRRAVVLGGALVASVAVLFVLPAPASAGPRSVSSAAAPAAGPCTDSRGVTVVVDFGPLSGGTKVRCAPAPVTSGFDALTRAGFTFEGTARFPGLLCRIDGQPTPNQDPCHNAPSTTAYWAYWYAPRGGDWTYSSSGAGSRKPPAGTVEGWAFGDGAKPSIAPPPPPPTTTTTRPPATTSPTVGSGGTAPMSATRGTTTTTTTGDVADEHTTTTEGDAGAAGTGNSDATTTSTDDGADELAAGDQAASAGGGSGSPVGAAAAGLAVVGLGGAAWWRNRRAGATG